MTRNMDRKRANDRARYWQNREAVLAKLQQRKSEDPEYLQNKRASGLASYHRHRDEKIARRHNRQDEIKTWFRQYKASLKCIRCGEDNPACLHFHHRNKHEKKTNISTYVFNARNLEEFIHELNKCDILCANCHLIEHWQERDEAADLLQLEKLQQLRSGTIGWFARKEIRRRIIQLENIIWLNRYKRTLACLYCGINQPACLHFHHTDPNKKYMEIGNFVRHATTLDQLQHEIDKCEVLCANCHAKLHWEQLYEETIED